MKTRGTVNHWLLALITLALIRSGLGASGAGAVITSPNGLYRGEAAIGPDPVHPTMERFRLCDGDGAVIWEDGDFRQNACWIANDGRAVVGLYSSGVEGLPGILTFFGPDGRRGRGVRVRNFSGGGFTGNGNMFYCSTGDLGIAAYGRDGEMLWAVGPGSRYCPSEDGGWLAVLRGDEMLVYREGCLWDAVALGASYVNGLEFDRTTGSFSFSTAGNQLKYYVMEKQLAARPCGESHEKPRQPPQRGFDPAIWPIDSTDAMHPLGNGWGEYQWYGGSPYFHPGIDVMALTDSGVPVRAVSHGWVKAWLTTSGTWHWRLAVADSGAGYSDSCDGWLYAHIDASRYHAGVGDEVFPGELIGYLVPWPVTGFDHLHFARIRDAGSVWGNAGADWVFQESPLNFLTPSTDTAHPVIEQALAGSKFAYCRNNTSQYLPASGLTGDVDIVARICDRFGPAIPMYPEWEKINPERIKYAVHGAGGAVPETASFLFSHFLPWDDVGLVNTVFKQDDSCVTYGDYDDRQYYYIVTNSDGDTVLEAGDTSGCWRTTDFPNGQYWVVVYASDQSGNTTADSQLVVVSNASGAAERPGAVAVRGGISIEPAPNPSGRMTSISFSLPEPCRADVSVYNQLGERVAALASGCFAAGEHLLRWNGRDRLGNMVPAGVYYVRVEAGGIGRTARMVRIK